MEEEILPGVRRLTAPNPSPMTFRGTNTYLIGRASVAVVDPGPEDAGHRAAIRRAAEAAGGRIVAILVTHTHVDHSQGAPRLAHETGAPLYAFGRHGDGRSATMAALDLSALGGGEGADRAFAPDRRLADGAVLETDEARITALHTPGHLSDHLCFALDSLQGGEGPRGALFSGDLVMGWSTSLVSPPDGDMGAFYASLARLSAREADAIYLPGHGDAVENPQARVAELSAHRRGREAEIVATLMRAGPLTAAALTTRIYVDVPRHLHPMAERNVLAHLIDLTERAVVAPEGPLGADAVFAAQR